MLIICTICNDLVDQVDNVYATECGHCFHYHCLTQWLERSNTCPQCRCKTTNKSMFRIYLTISDETTVDDAATLQSRLDDTSLQLRLQKEACTKYEVELKKLENELKENVECSINLQSKITHQLELNKRSQDHMIDRLRNLNTIRTSAVISMEEQMAYLMIQNQETCKLKEENDELKKNILTLTGAVRESEDKKNKFRQRLIRVSRANLEKKSKVTEFQQRLYFVLEKLSYLKSKYQNANSKRKAPEVIDLTESSPKQMRMSDASDRLTTPLLNDSGSSVHLQAAHTPPPPPPAVTSRAQRSARRDAVRERLEQHSP